MIKEGDFKDNTDTGKPDIKDKNLKLIIIACLIMSVVITVIHNINIDLYIRDLIIPCVLMLGGYIFLIYKNKLETNKKAYILLVPIILILLSDCIVGIDISNKILNVFILPFLISMFFFLLANKNYKINKESLTWIFKLFPSGIFCNLKYIKIFPGSFKGTKIVLNIFLGSLIGIPIAMVLLYLLVNADKYFSEFIGVILNFVSKILSINYIFSDLLTIGIIFVITFSIFINILKNKDSKLKEAGYKEINHIIASTVLVIINAIFILFLMSEISKLTVNILQLPIKYTYAEYAREGFFQLLAVTTINFAIIIYYLYHTKVISNNSFVKKLILLLITFSIILIFNSYYRMFLYIGAYGFTVLRLQVILFLAMELILFAILIKKIIDKLKYDEATIFMIIVCFYILNIYFCTSGFSEMINNF